MRALKLFAHLTAYYVVLAAIVFAGLSLFPTLQNYLPVGGVEALISQPAQPASASPNILGDSVQISAQQVGSLGESLIWLVIAIIGALLISIPVSWVYMEVRDPEEYDQSLIGTIVMLPVIVTSIVIIVHNSLALAFSLAGIAGAVRFRNSLKSSGDALFILLSVGIGLSAGIGAMELSLVMSIAFNYCFLGLWLAEYGERIGMKRYMSDVDAEEPPPPPEAPAPPAPTANP